VGTHAHGHCDDRQPRVLQVIAPQRPSKSRWEGSLRGLAAIAAKTSLRF
jgi:hypothetical protein